MSIKRTKFVTLAEKRTQRALRDIRLIGNLSNRGSYDYTPRDVGKIFQALESEVIASRKRFENRMSKGESGFSLK